MQNVTAWNKSQKCFSFRCTCSPLCTQCVESKKRNHICWKLYLKTTQMSSGDDFFFLYLSNNRTGSLHFNLLKAKLWERCKIVTKLKVEESSDTRCFLLSQNITVPSVYRGDVSCCLQKCCALPSTFTLLSFQRKAGVKHQRNTLALLLGPTIPPQCGMGRWRLCHCKTNRGREPLLPVANYIRGLCKAS